MSRLQRVGVAELPAHLNQTYGIEVIRTQELDLGVHRIDLADGSSWVARLFPAERPIEQTRGDAAILRLLAGQGYPAERCAVGNPVSVHEGQAVLVTEFVPGVPRTLRREAIRAAGGLAALGFLLGRLHTLPVAGAAIDRPGGAWHHLADGAPAAELAALRALLGDAKPLVSAADSPLYERLEVEAGSFDDGTGLPESLVHPDFVMANVVAPPTGGLVVVDWAGAGRASRAWSLAFLLWSVGFGGDFSRVDRTVAGYRRHLTPELAELERLEALIRVRPVVFECWAFSTGRRTLDEAARKIVATRDLAASIADRALAAFSRDPNV